MFDVALWPLLNKHDNTSVISSDTDACLVLCHQQEGLMKVIMQLSVALELVYHLTCLIITEKNYN